MEQKDLRFSQFLRKQKIMRVTIQECEERLKFLQYQTKRVGRNRFYFSPPTDRNELKKKVKNDLIIFNKQRIGDKVK